ncbi:hypothetical protein [Stieleria maiorica]|uniref:hypothetical protein n=1 Tax=Stieleria maiorica TaxID=2795974 RepID=UPI0011C9116F|nr:hypothetical protein [Stieleria maiorica]
MKKNNTISPWLGTLNLDTQTPYGVSDGLRRDVEFFRHRRVNRTLCSTSSPVGYRMVASESDFPVVLLIVWAMKIWVNN